MPKQTEQRCTRFAVPLGEEAEWHDDQRDAEPLPGNIRIRHLLLTVFHRCFLTGACFNNPSNRNCTTLRLTKLVRDKGLATSLRNKRRVPLMRTVRCDRPSKQPHTCQTQRCQERAGSADTRTYDDT